MWLNIFLVALGGACGAVSRWGLTSLFHTENASRFPYGTLAVNWIGCLLFGFAIQIIGDKWQFHPQARLLLLTGFFGAFTTFSTYAWEASNLFQNPDSRWFSAVGHVLLHNFVGIALIFAGIGLATLIRTES